MVEKKGMKLLHEELLVDAPKGRRAFLKVYQIDKNSFEIEYFSELGNEKRIEKVKDILKLESIITKLLNNLDNPNFSDECFILASKITKEVKKIIEKKVVEPLRKKKLSEEKIIARLKEISELDMPLEVNKKLRELKNECDYPLQVLQEQLSQYKEPKTPKVILKEEKPTEEEIRKKAQEEFERKKIKKEESKRLKIEEIKKIEEEREKEGWINEQFGSSGGLQQEILTQIALRKPRDATELLVRSFLDDNFVYSTRDDKKSEMWIYRNGIYIPEGESYIREFCNVVLGKVYTTTLTNEVIEKIRGRTYIDQAKFFNQELVYEIPIQEGILNLKTRTISPFTHDKIFFSKLPLNYNPKAKCEKIAQFFKDVLPHEEDIKVMYEIFGFLLLKEYVIEKAIMFNGEGRNGKGKTLKLMEKFVGSDNVCNVGLTSMQKDNFDLEDLFGKLLNVGGDTGKTSLKDTGCFKELTARDGVNLPRKFKRSLRIVNYAKMLFACNDLPIVYDDTHGFWSRWILQDFPFEFLTKEEIALLPEDQRTNKKLIDINILEKISTQDELNGLLNEALDGLDRLLKNSDFSYSKGTDEIKRMWKRRANSFLAFCQDCIEEDDNSSIIKLKLKKAYGLYCKKYNLKTRVGEKTIKYTLENEYFVEEIRDQDRKYMWIGIKFKEKEIPEEPEKEDIPMIPTTLNPYSNILKSDMRVKQVGIIGIKDDLKGNISKEKVKTLPEWSEEDKERLKKAEEKTK